MIDTGDSTVKTFNGETHVTSPDLLRRLSIADEPTDEGAAWRSQTSPTAGSGQWDVEQTGVTTDVDALIADWLTAVQA